MNRAMALLNVLIYISLTSYFVGQVSCWSHSENGVKCKGTGTSCIKRGSKCCSGKCVKTDGDKKCECSSIGLPCNKAKDCCDMGATCFESSCILNSECLRVEESCRQDSECCTSKCRKKKCKCSKTNRKCIEDSDCCNAQSSCLSGVCSSKTPTSNAEAVVKLEDPDAVDEALKKYLNSTSEDGWVLLQYVQPQFTLKLQAAGSGTTQSMAPFLKDNEIQYGRLRIRIFKKNEPEQTRDVLIRWIGPGVGIIDKGKKRDHYVDAKKYLKIEGGITVEVTVTNKRNFMDDVVADKSDPMAGSGLIE